MSKDDDWYRSQGWSSKDKALFEEKISRARGNSSRSQYARIKALALIESGDDYKLEVAIELLRRSLKDWPSEFDLDTEDSHAALGDAYRCKKNFDAAIEAYEKAITWSNSRNTAYWSYPEMIVVEQLTSLYNRALEIVSRLHDENELIMEYEKFLYHTVKAMVFQKNGSLKEARKEAETALESVEIKKSVFSRHSDVGLVSEKRFGDLIRHLKRI